MADSYATAQAAVDAVLPGYKIIGSEAVSEEVANPEYTGPTDVTHPKTIKQPRGTKLSLQGPNKEPETITISTAQTGGPGKGNVGYTILEGPTKAPAGSNKATPASNLERLDANLQPTTDPAKTVYVRDPNAPAGTAPFKLEQAGDLGDPSTWTPIYDPNDTSQVNRRVIGYYDPKAQKVAANVTAAAGAKESDPSQWTPVYRVPGDKSSGIVGQYDPVNKELHAVSASPDGKQIVTTPSAIYNVDKDTGTATKLTDLTPDHPTQVVTYPDGTVYTYDQYEKDLSKRLVKIQDGHLPQTIQGTDINGRPTTLVLDPKTNQYGFPPGTEGSRSIDQTPSTSRSRVILDAQGNVVSTTPNPNYHPTQATQGSQSTTARMIQQWDPQANNGDGGWVWVENKGRVVASEALRSMASRLSQQVVDGDISQDEAVQIINGANAAMTNDINQQNARREAATGVITGVNNAAQTGAGLLQNRITAATGVTNQAISALSSGKLGADLPGDWGRNLLGGLQSWVTELGGGQGTYDAAAEMVKQANPNISQNPGVAAQAYQALRGLMDLHTAQTGQPSQVEIDAVNRAKAASGGGFPAPATSSGPTTQGNEQALAANQQANAQAAGTAGQVTTATLNAAGYADNAVGRAQYTAKMPAAGIGKWPPPATAPPGMTNIANPSYALGSAVGQPAVGPVVGGNTGAPWGVPGVMPVQPLPMPQGFRAPMAA